MEAVTLRLYRNFIYCVFIFEMFDLLFLKQIYAIYAKLLKGFISLQKPKVIIAIPFENNLAGKPLLFQTEYNERLYTVNVSKRTFEHVRPAKIQTSLCIRAV